jgi:transposase
MSGYPLDSFDISKSDERISLIMPDRTAEAVKPWLASHPEIQVVSQDRASAFADAVSQVLPHATQVADRYHLVVRRIGVC